MARQQQGPALRDLKSTVYSLAGVSTTRDLKALAPSLARLDFRRRTSWLQARTCFEAGSNSFEQWLAKPPEDYQTLFAEIQDALADFRAGLDQGFQLSRELIEAADELQREALRERNREARDQLN
jgi:hypothetical protein